MRGPCDHCSTKSDLLFHAEKDLHCRTSEKAGWGETDSSPVFTYLVSEIGESRDTRRIAIEANDLMTMVREFCFFRSAPEVYVSKDPRCKLLPWSTFDGMRNWLVDRNWTHDEKVELKIVEETFEVDPAAFRDLVADAKAALDGLLAQLS